ncbi:MAG: helix-turn-helix transcriptional regulator [Crenarchaeota archaeon]|nr:helix-turn-helix transcriptional regulator [Thermoproteota archaeon]
MAGLQLSAKLKLFLEVNGHEIDEDTLKLLALVEAMGSILKASRALGMAYSRAWERIARIERVTGFKIIEAKRGGRGGGGARLTPIGRQLVAKFLEEYRRIFGANPLEGSSSPRLAEVMIYAGSNDPLLEKILGVLREDYACEVHWIGSMRGLASIVLGEAWVTGIHLLDEDSGLYNEPYIEKLKISDLVIRKPLFWRVQGFMVRAEMSYSEVIEGLLRGRLRLVNRCWGSGTRILLDHVLRAEARKLGVDPSSIPKLVKGYDREVSTHVEVAKLVASGEADVGMGIEWAAQIYGLNFVRVKEELFELVVRKDVAEEPPVQRLLELVESELPLLIKGFPGYRLAR